MANSRENLLAFTNWVSSKNAQDFSAMVYRGSLHRTTIAIECGFAKSVLLQNPKIRDLLKELEDRLRAEGILRFELHSKKQNLANCIDEPDSDEARNPHPHVIEPAGVVAPEYHVTSSQNLERLVRRLQSENASQRAEIQELRKQLAKLSGIHEVLATTGRIPR
jgi:hypothetical protein